MLLTEARQFTEVSGVTFAAGIVCSKASCFSATNGVPPAHFPITVMQTCPVTSSPFSPSGRQDTLQSSPRQSQIESTSPPSHATVDFTDVWESARRWSVGILSEAVVSSVSYSVE